MSGSPINRYLSKPLAPAAREEPKELGFTSEAGASPRMIDFITRNGDHTALPYPYLVGARLVGGNAIELEFTEKSVRIKGRTLGPLYQHLLAQTVRRIEESVGGFDEGRVASWVESITVETRG